MARIGDFGDCFDGSIAFACRGLAALALFGASIAVAAPPGRIVPTPTGFGRSGDEMGAATAVLGDTALVGSPLAAPAPLMDSGAVQVFRNGATGWQREAVLAPSQPSSGERFGAEVALGPDVAAIGADSVGKTYVFTRNGTSWTQTDTLTFGGYPSLSGDTLAISSGLGVRVYTRQGGAWVVQADIAGDLAGQGEFITGMDVSGDVLAFSTVGDDGNGETGHINEYFYSRTNATWTRDTKIDFGDFLIHWTTPPQVALSGESAIMLFGGVRVLVRSDGSWPLQQELDAGIPWDMVAPASVAIDADRAVVGCPGDSVLGISEQGSAFVFERTGSTWSRVARPYDADGSYQYHFGTSVALSGDNLIVGSPGAMADDVKTGTATPIAFDTGTWSAGPSLDEGNAHANEVFGSAIAISGSSVIAGAPYAMFDTPGTSGAAYVFEAVGNRWTQRAQLVPPSQQHYGFGSAVALDGDTAAVSSNGDNIGDPDDYGAVYVYRRAGDDWPQEQRIASGLLQSTFGASLALEGDLLAIGDMGWSGQQFRGRVRTFTRSGTVWTEQALIQPVESSDNDYFGSSQALSGTTLVVGAWGANVDIESAAGAAYVFENVGGTWQQQARLVAPAPLQGTGFGNSVAVAGDTIVVGTMRPSGDDAAFVFVRDGSDWTLQGSLHAPDQPSNSTNYSVAISADASIAIVGAPAASSAGIYRRDGDTWSLAAVVHGRTLPNSDLFGAAVAFSGTDAVVGAPEEPVGGAAYVIPLGNEIFADGFD